MEIEKSITELLARFRARQGQHLELEIRIGRISADHKFIAGFPFANRGVVNRLGKMLRIRSQKNPATWVTKKNYMFQRALYRGNVRQTCIPDKTRAPHYSTYIVKTRLNVIDLKADREFGGVRFVLNQEMPVDTKSQLYENAKKGAPLWVRTIERVSFTESFTTPWQTPVVLQYDISKLSNVGPNKMIANNTDQCEYQCELELASSLRPRSDGKTIEEAENRWIAEVLLQRTNTLVGSHEQIKTQKNRLLPPPKYQLIHHDLDR